MFAANENAKTKNGHSRLPPPGQNRPLWTEHLLKAKKMADVSVHYGRFFLAPLQTVTQPPKARQVYIRTQIFPAIYMKSLEDPIQCPQPPTNMGARQLY